MEITTIEMEARLREEFPRSYKRFSSFVESGELWQTLIDSLRNAELMSHYVFCNDVMGIPPVRVHLCVYPQLRRRELSREEKQAMGAFWGFVFKELLGYREQESVSCVIGGVKTATRYGNPCGPQLARQ